MTERIDTALARHRPLPLWPEGAPGRDRYPEGEEPRLTAYQIDDDRVHSAVVVCPGGGYVGRAPHEGEPIARMLNGHGISAFVLDYRVAPVRHPYPSMDGMRAIRWVRHYADVCRVDPNRIGILGFSAGGHLASTVGTMYERNDAVPGDPIDQHSSRPDALILCYPVISFVSFAHLGSAQNLLGPDPTRKQLQSLSTELLVDENTPPTFLWHTAEDAGVPVENSLMFAAALSACKVPFALHIFPHGAHGLGLAEGVPEVASWPALLGEWLAGIGF